LVLALALLTTGPVALQASRTTPAPDAAPTTARTAMQNDLPEGHIQVRGQIVYVDSNSDRNHPAAGVRVEIWDLDSGFPTTSEKLAEARTDLAGFFESPPILNADRDGAGGEPGVTGQDIFLKIYTNNGDVRLLKTNTPNEFVWQSYEIDERNGIKRNVADGAVSLPRLVIMENTPNIEALWTFVAMAEAWLYMREQTGEEPGSVLGYWSIESRDGPRYDPATRALYFRDDNAGYSDVVGQHTAYALLHNIYSDLPTAWEGCTAGPGAEVKTRIDEACALLQGFATFLPLAVYQDPIFESQTVRALDMDAPQPVSPGWEDGDRVPGRIAGAFWDLYEHDQTVEEADSFNATFADIWEVFDRRNPTTMREWWAGWKDLGKETCGASGSLYQNSIDYNNGPVVSPPIPDIAIDEDETFNMDVLDFVTDVECGRDKLIVELENAGSPEAGVSLEGSLLKVEPQSNWFGQTTIRLRISDGAISVMEDVLVLVRSVNDCPTIRPRIADPAAVRYGDPITVSVKGLAADVEDPVSALTWDVELDPQQASDITISGLGSDVITFTPDASIISDYSARALIVLRDSDGCDTKQSVALNWRRRPNFPPFIIDERLTREYTAPKGVTIRVDLTGVASDDEDGPDPLEWFVLEPGSNPFSTLKVSPQIFDFVPFSTTLGSYPVQLEVADTDGLRATADITVTWVITNAAPIILRNRLRGKTVGAGDPSPEACYELRDKATDSDDPIASLTWWLSDYNAANLQVSGQGGKRLCLRPRPNFEGCERAAFVVRDPHGNEDSHEIATCWRKIEIRLPRVDTGKPAGRP
jgi:hypothetical protein